MKKNGMGRYLQLILIYAACLLLVLCFVGFGSLSRATSAFDREVVTLNRSLVEHNVETLKSQILDPTETLAVNLSVDPTDSALIWSLMSRRDTPLYKIVKLHDHLRDIYFANFKMISDIRVYIRHSNMILSSRIGAYYLDDHTEANRYANDWVEELTFTGRRWLSTHPAEYPGAEGTQLSFAMSIFHGSRTAPDAYIIVDVNESVVRSLLTDLVADDEETLFVIDGEGGIVSSTDPSLYSSDGEAFSVPRLDGMSQTADVVNLKIDGKFMALCYSAPCDNGWRVCRMIDASAYYASVRSMEAGILLTVGIALLIGAVLSVYFSRRLYRPVSHLTRSLASEISASAELDRKNEYAVIHSAIVSMRDKMDTLRSRVEDDRDMIKSYMVLSLFNGAVYDDLVLHSRMKQIGCDMARWPYMTVVRVTLSSVLTDMKPEEMRYIRRDILDRLEACRDERTEVLAAEVSYNELAAALLTDMPDRNDMLDALCLHLMEQYERHVEISVGAWQKSVRELHLSYTTAVEAQAYQFFHPDWLCCDYNTIGTVGFSDSAKLATACDAFTDAVRRRDLDGAIRSLQLLSFAEQDNIYPLNEAMKPLAAMTASVAQAARGGIDSTESVEQFVACEHNGGFKSIREYAIRMCHLLYDLFGAGEAQPRNSQIIEQLKHYIDQNLHRDLSLTVLAEYANLSPSYLSRLFRKEMGVSLVDYLTATRLERGRQLLEQTDQSIEMISLEVGYPTHHYFSRKFREKYGMTPRDYRQQSALHKAVSAQSAG